MYRTLLMTLLALATALSAQTNPFAGTFANDQLMLTLQETNGRITGQVQLQGQSFPVTAQLAGANSIQGTYSYLGQHLPFSATLSGSTMTLTSEGEVFTLQKTTETAARATTAAPQAPQALAPQNPNEVIDKELGVRFTMPNGWVAKKAEAGYFLGSNTEKGFILLTAHEFTTLEQLRAEAKKGMVEANGTNLQMMGEMVNLGSNAVGATFHGTLEGQQAKAFIAGVVSSLGDGGATIMAATEAASFSEKYAEHVRGIVASMKFFKPETPPIAQQWKRELSGARLTYLWSYSSRGYTDGSYAGGSQQIEIHLCPQGFFKYTDKSHTSIDGGYSTGYNASAFGSGKDQGQGTWEVAARVGTPILVLKFHDGRVNEYKIAYENQKLYLNGNRYFWTTANSEIADQRPACW